MSFIEIFSHFIFIILINSTFQWHCDFDHGQKCFYGLETSSSFLFDDKIDNIRQPASDVSSILTSNNAGECRFPYEISSIKMCFCLKNDSSHPSKCPNSNGDGSWIYCNDGEYGYELFASNKIGVRTYQLERIPRLDPGYHCLRFYYYLSDGMSNAVIDVNLHDPQLNLNRTVAQVHSYLGNKWIEHRETFHIEHNTSKIYFSFKLKTSSVKPFFFGIDEITLHDFSCDPSLAPPLTTTTTTTTTNNSSTTRTDFQILINIFLLSIIISCSFH